MVKTTMAIEREREREREREIDDAKSIRDAGSSGKRKESHPSSSTGKKQRTYTPQWFQG